MQLTKGGFLMEGRIDHTSQLPLYLQIKNLILDNIESRLWKVGTRIPAERGLAEELGVSQMTVNRSIQELVREGILTREVGSGTFICKYPSHVTKDYKIAIVYPMSEERIMEAYYPQFIFRGIQESASKASISLTLLKRLEQYSPTNEADGCIIIAPHIDRLDELNRFQRKYGIPIVVLGSHWPDAMFYCVDSHNFQGTYDSTNHLISLGHRSIGAVIGETYQCNVRDRIAGYEAALEDAGLEVYEELTIHIDYLRDRKNNELKILKALNSPLSPTAFVAVGYQFAIEVMSILQDHGISIPEDISIAGYDDPHSARYLTPSLTTVRQPLEEMGFKAIQLLKDIIDGKKATDNIHLLPTELIIRESTAKPVSS
jgi:DNA-binding LacI/PurR family transcriptional regulator